MTNHTDSSKEIEIPKELSNWIKEYVFNMFPPQPKRSWEKEQEDRREWATEAMIDVYRHLHPSPSPSEWIELKDGCEMPEIDEQVLWHREDGNFFVREIDKDDNAWWKGDPEADLLFGSGSRCTHWSRIISPTASGDK